MSVEHEDKAGGWLRLSGRALGAIASTAGHLAVFEIDTKRQGLDATALLPTWVPRWSRSLLDIFGVELDIEGGKLGEPYPGRGPNGVGRVFVMNHRSAVDVLVLFATTEAQLVSRHDLAAWPGIGFGARRIGTMFVDRASMRSGATVLKEMTRTLEAGRGVALFPEGTAFAGDEVHPLRPGAFKAAIRTDAEIIPMGIAYADEAAYFGDETFADHVRRVGTLRHLEASLIFGQPIQPGAKKLVDLRDETREAIQALVHRARARVG
jgi:lyso-ornithine lipid O-acyltransferase